jgi:hypothetical protein
MFIVRRFPAIILIFTFCALGSGATEFLHNAQHEAEDARENLLRRQAGLPDAPAAPHDDSNCAVHLQLHLPALPAFVPPLAVSVAMLVGVLSLALPRVISYRVPVAIDCRGPPRH